MAKKANKEIVSEEIENVKTDIEHKMTLMKNW